MKGRALILIFLFILLIVPVGAETITDYWSVSSTTHEEVAPGGSGIYNGYTFGIGTFTLGDAAQLRSMKLYTMKIPNAYVTTSKDSEYNGVTFKIGATVVGSGLAGYSTGADHTFVHYWFQDLDLSGYSGSQVMTVDGVPTTIDCGNHYYKDQAAPTNQEVYLRTYYAGRAEWYGWRQTTHDVQMSYEFKNTITVEFAEPLSSVTTYRDDGNQSMFNITQNSVQILYEDSLNAGTNVTYSDLTSSFTVTGENQYGDLYSHVFTGVMTTSGDIEFNQTHYTDPENIEVEWDIDNYNGDCFVYEIQVITSVSGNPSQDSWPADGNWNVSPFISSASGAAVFDFYSAGYDLPIWIQGELWAQDKSSGTWTKLDNTPAVVYHEAALDSGKIWTDKSNYNVTELVEISYTTNVTDNYIAVEEPYSIWSTHNVPVGTYSFLYELAISAVGNTDIYLFENGELVDQVIISVSSESGDDAYAVWMKDYYFEGETASFYYYSSNASAQITVYDGADIIVFGPATTQLGYHNGRVNTANTNPGTFLLSLYHNGTYYNDTMIFESADSWVRFDSSKYYIGDTINIEYYLSDPTHQISMWDANQKKVVRFTSDFGLVSGSMQTLPYTLSEYNEYSHDIPGRLASGELTLGFWDIFIEERKGVLGDSWDEAYVCYATDDDDGSYGTDASNEMISIFFSPEGIFLLFTAALTMMGLVAAHHPAGGGAGAVVGVGFGVYFKVLPVWMLLLMVIAFVVLAGVSVAVHFKGK